MHLNSELKQRRRRRQRERQKSKQTRLAKQQLSTCIMFFCTFLCRRCTNTTWNVLVTRFMEDVNTRRRFSFPELRYSPHHKTDSMKFNKSNKVSKQHDFASKWRLPLPSCLLKLPNTEGPYDPSTETSMKTSLKNRLGILSNRLAIIPSRPVTGFKEGNLGRSWREGTAHELRLQRWFNLFPCVPILKSP